MSCVSWRFNLRPRDGSGIFSIEFVGDLVDVIAASNLFRIDDKVTRMRNDQG